MEKIIKILVFLTLLHVGISNYPNCVQDLVAKSNQDTNFNKKFIKLSQFLFKEKQTETLNRSISIQSRNYESYTQFMTDSRVTFIIIFTIVGLLCFILIAIRTKWSYFHRLRYFLGKNIGGIVNPCAISVSIIAFTFFILFASTSSLLPSYLQAADCSQRYIKQIILYGHNQSNWSGFYGYQKLIRLHMKYLEIVQNMPSSYDFKIAPIQNRNQSTSAFANQLLSQYQNAYVQYNSEQIGYQTLLPYLFDSKELLIKLNESNNKLITIGETAMNIQNSVKDTKISSENNRLSLQTKIPSFLMPAQELNNNIIFRERFKKGKGKQSGDIINLATRIFIGIGLQTSFSFFCIILISLRVRHSLFLKFINFLWVLLIGQFLLSFLLMYMYSAMARGHSHECPGYEQALYSEQGYYSYTNTTSNTNQNIFRLLYPCLFKNSTFDDMAIYSQDSKGLLSLMGNLTYYMSIMDPMHANYSDSYGYSRAYSEAINYVIKQQYNVNQNWPYLTSVLEQLNNYTLNNRNNDSCYKSRWVFDRSGCTKGENILNMTFNSLLIGATANYSAYPIECIPLNSRDAGGNLKHIANYSDIMTNYQGNKNESRCASTVVQIERVAITLTNAMLSKYQSMEALKNELSSQVAELDQFLRILRTNYLLKKDQFSYMITMGGSTSRGTKTDRDWNYALKTHSNCSCVREWTVIAYEILCVDMRADILKTYLILVLLEIALAFLIILGAIYGFNEQLKQIQHLLPDDSISVHKQPMAHKFMSHFFAAKRD